MFLLQILCGTNVCKEIDRSACFNCISPHIVNEIMNNYAIERIANVIIRY